MAGTNFELVKEALDELFGVVISACGGQDPKQVILAELDRLSESYRNLEDENRSAVDYSSPISRFAYLYTYVAAHSFWVYQLLTTTRLTKDLIAGKQHLTATCLGGGPGTEVVALARAASRLGREAPILCFQLDREDGWTETWAGIADRMEGAEFRMSTSMRTMDVLNPLRPENLAKAFQADLFFAVFFLSEIYSVRGRAAPFLHAMVAAMKKGAIVVYLDNSGDDFTNHVESIFTPALFNTIRATDHRDLRLSPSEERRSLGPHLKLLGRDPRLKAHAAYRIWQKK